MRQVRQFLPVCTHIIRWTQWCAQSFHHQGWKWLTFIFVSSKKCFCYWKSSNFLILILSPRWWFVKKKWEFRFNLMYKHTIKSVKTLTLRHEKTARQHNMWLRSSSHHLFRFPASSACQTQCSDFPPRIFYSTPNNKGSQRNCEFCKVLI